MVVAVVVNRPLSVEKQSILAGLHRQGSVGAQEEQVAGLRVGVRLDSVLFRAGWGVSHQNAGVRLKKRGVLLVAYVRGSKTVSTGLARADPFGVPSTFT